MQFPLKIERIDRNCHIHQLPDRLDCCRSRDGFAIEQLFRVNKAFVRNVNPKIVHIVHILSSGYAMILTRLAIFVK